MVCVRKSILSHIHIFICVHFELNFPLVRRLAFKFMAGAIWLMTSSSGLESVHTVSLTHCDQRDTAWAKGVKQLALDVDKAAQYRRVSPLRAYYGRENTLFAVQLIDGF